MPCVLWAYPDEFEAVVISSELVFPPTSHRTNSLQTLHPVPFNFFLSIESKLPWLQKHLLDIFVDLCSYPCLAEPLYDYQQMV